MTQPVITIPMNGRQWVLYHAHMAVIRKDEVVGVLLALLFGAFGAHHFYLRRTGLGVFYLLFCWTGITALLGVIECFFMPGRVRRYNAEQGQILASAIMAGAYPVLAFAPAPLTLCGACGAASPAGLRYCARCGAALTAANAPAIVQSPA